MLYLFCLCLGFAGLAATALLGHFHGFGHHAPGHAGAHGAHGHGGNAHGHANAHGHGGGHAHAHAKTTNHWLWLSPRVLFSLLFAFGATGILLSNLLPAAGVVIASLVAAFLFERWLVQPIWRVLFGFASNPARTLDYALLEEAEAVTDFDARGQGLVALNLDGQVVQLLGSITPTDRDSGVRIRTGDRLSIVAVDCQRNRCTVTRASAAHPAVPTNP